jgi:hypothetical protein
VTTTSASARQIAPVQRVACGVGRANSSAFIGSARSHAPRFVHGHRVVCHHAGAATQQFGHDHAAGRLAHVVGVGLEGQAPQREACGPQVVAEALDDAVHQHVLLALVGALHRLQQVQRLAHRAGAVQQRLHVLGKARAAVAAAGVQELVADARVAADAAAHLFDVGAELLGQQRHLVHEADARGQHRVGGVLGQLGRADVHHDQLVALALEGRVQRLHQQHGAVVVGADDDAVGRMKSSTAAPSFRNSGLETTLKGTLTPALRQPPAMASCTASAVPTGTVLLSTTSL